MRDWTLLHHWLRGALRLLISLWAVATLTFLLVRALPGNPVDVFVLRLMQTGLSEREALARASSLLRLDLDRPLAAQYAEFIGNLARGDLGESYVVARGRPVRELVLQRLPWTIFSVGLALAVSLGAGILLGLLAAYRRGSWLDHLLTNASAALDATPPLFVAVLLVLLLGVVWRVVPPGALRGALSPGVQPGLTPAFFADLLAHWLAPGAVYIAATVGGWLLAMRGSTLGVLGDDYVTAARARGLPEWRIMAAYVGRNAGLPILAGAATALGLAIGGSVVIEQVFVYPGVGLLLGQAIAARDYPLMQGVFLVTTAAVLVANAVADALYGWLDPRVREAL